MVNKGREHWKFKRAWAYLHEVTIDPGLGRPGRAVHIGNVAPGATAPAIPGYHVVEQRRPQGAHGGLATYYR